MSSVFRRPWLLRYCQSIVCARVPEDGLQYPGVVHAQIRKVDVPSRRLLISDTHACIWAKLTEECMDELSRFRTNLVELVGGIIQLTGFELKISVPDLNPAGQGTWTDLMMKESPLDNDDHQEQAPELILNVWAMDYNGGDEIEVQGDPLICSRDREIVIGFQETPLGELQNRMRTRQLQPVSATTTTPMMASGPAVAATPDKWKPSWDLDSFCAIAEETRQAERSRLIEVHPSEPGSELQEEENSDHHQSPSKAKAPSESLKSTSSSNNDRVSSNPGTEENPSGYVQTEDSTSSSQDDSGYFVTGEVEVKPRGGGATTTGGGSSMAATPPAVTKHVSFAIRTPLQDRLKEPRDLSEQEMLQNPKLGKFTKRKSDFSPAVRVTPSKKIPSESPLVASSASVATNDANSPVRTPQAAALVEATTNRSPSKKKVLVGESSPAIMIDSTSISKVDDVDTGARAPPTTTTIQAVMDTEEQKRAVPEKEDESPSKSASTTTPKSSASSSESNVVASLERGFTPSPPPEQQQQPQQQQSIMQMQSTPSKLTVKHSTNLDVLASAVVLEEEAKRGSSPVRVHSSVVLNNTAHPPQALAVVVAVAAAASPSGLEQDESPIIHEEEKVANVIAQPPPQQEELVLTSSGTESSLPNYSNSDPQKQLGEEGRRQRLQYQDATTTTAGSQANVDEMADTESEASTSAEEEVEEQQEEKSLLVTTTTSPITSSRGRRAVNGSGAFAIVGKKQQQQKQQKGRKGKENHHQERFGPLTQKGDDEEDEDDDDDEEEEEAENMEKPSPKRGENDNDGNHQQQQQNSSSSEPSTRLEGPLTQMPMMMDGEGSERQQQKEQSSNQDKTEGKRRANKSTVVPRVRRSKRLQLGPLTQAGGAEEEEDEETIAANGTQQSEQSSEKQEEDIQQCNHHLSMESQEKEEDESPLVSSMDIETMNGVRPAATKTATTRGQTKKSTTTTTTTTTMGKTAGRSSTSSSNNKQPFKLKKTVFTSIPRISVNTKMSVNWVAEGGPGFMRGMEEGDQIVSVQGKKELREIRLALENGPLPLEVVWRSRHSNISEEDEEDFAHSYISDDDDDEEEEEEDDDDEEEDIDDESSHGQHHSGPRPQIGVALPTSGTTSGTRRRRQEPDDLVGQRYEHFWGGMVYHGEVVVKTNKDEYLLRDVDGAEQIVDRAQAQRLVSGELSVPHEHIRDPFTRKTQCVSPQQQPPQQPRSFRLVVPPSSELLPSSSSSSSSKKKKPLQEQTSPASKSKASAASNSAVRPLPPPQQQSQPATKRIKLMRKKLTMIDEESENEAETVSWADFKRMRQKGAGRGGAQQQQQHHVHFSQ